MVATTGLGLLGLLMGLLCLIDWLLKLLLGKRSRETYCDIDD